MAVLHRFYCTRIYPYNEYQRLYLSEPQIFIVEKSQSLKILCFGAVTYHRIKVTDAERTEKCEKRLSGGGSAVVVVAEVVGSAYVPDK